MIFDLHFSSFYIILLTAITAPDCSQAQSVSDTNLPCVVQLNSVSRKKTHLSSLIIENHKIMTLQRMGVEHFTIDFINIQYFTRKLDYQIQRGSGLCSLANFCAAKCFVIIFQYNEEWCRKIQTLIAILVHFIVSKI